MTTAFTVNPPRIIVTKAAIYLILLISCALSLEAQNLPLPEQLDWKPGI
jgi:hypothetical protein